MVTYHGEMELEMSRRIMLVVFLLIFMFLFTGCGTDTIELNYYQEEKSKQQSSVLESNIGIGEFTGTDLTVIPSESLLEDENLPATASLLINRTDNKVIYADDIYQRMYPASLTKLLTALVTFEQEANLREVVTISHNASNITESGAKLARFKEGDKIDLESLLNIVLVYSANDASIALAEHVLGSEEAFVEEMNKVAKRLGAVHSNFVNSHGLHDDGQYTTAYDMYLIINELLGYEEFVSIINKSSVDAVYKDIEGNSISNEYMNTNRYLLDRAKAPENITVIGGKTGTTSQAGNCLSLYSVDYEGKEYISIVMEARGGDSLYRQMTYLLDMVD